MSRRAGVGVEISEPGVLKRALKIALLAAGVLVIGVVGLFFYGLFAGQEQVQEAANPCERACINDSGGIVSCRQECASHPLTYGPETLLTSDGGRDARDDVR